MQEQVEDEVYFSGDFCPMEEESMPETALHAKLIQYLVEVLEWLFRGRLCAIHRNLAFYQAPERKAPPVAPDIAVIKGIPFQPVNSWHVGRTGSPPHVIFEILSTETWKKDVEEKPAFYARMGVQEYFASTVSCGSLGSKPQRGGLRPWLRNCARRGLIPTRCEDLAGGISFFF
jgi:hypothetical protein